MKHTKSWGKTTSKVRRGTRKSDMNLDLFVGLKDADNFFRYQAASVLGGWEHQSEAVPVLVELLKDANSGVQLQAALELGGWGKGEAVVRTVVARVYPKNQKQLDTDAVANFLLAAANSKPRAVSAELRQLLVKGLKPTQRDSVERQELRKVLFHWVWNALATTA